MILRLLGCKPKQCFGTKPTVKTYLARAWHFCATATTLFISSCPMLLLFVCRDWVWNKRDPSWVEKCGENKNGKDNEKTVGKWTAALIPVEKIHMDQGEKNTNRIIFSL